VQDGDLPEEDKKAYLEVLSSDILSLAIDGMVSVAKGAVDLARPRGGWWRCCCVGV